MTNRRVGSTGVAIGSCISLPPCRCDACESIGPHTHDRPHITSCTPTCVTATSPQSLPPHAPRQSPVVVAQTPRAIAASKRQNVNTVAPTTRGRLHSPNVKRTSEKRSTRKENARLFHPALKTHQISSSRADEQNCTQVVWKVVACWQLISRPYTRRHTHVCKRGYTMSEFL